VDVAHSTAPQTAMSMGDTVGTSACHCHHVGCRRQTCIPRLHSTKMVKNFPTTQDQTHPLQLPSSRCMFLE